jgi:hypothetical protein
MNKIKATCAILNRATEEIISERLIGYFDNADTASHVAHLQRKGGYYESASLRVKILLTNYN